MAVKFTFKWAGSKRIVDNLKQAIYDGVSKKAFDEIGEFIVELIYKRTKSGKGLTEQKRGASIKKLDGLSEGYKKFRKNGLVTFKTKNGDIVKFFVKPPKGGEFFKPTRSNLTLTGQMLEALDSNASTEKVQIFVKPSNRKDGKNTNAEIAKYVQENGRPFLELSDKEVKQVQARLTRIIRENIRKIRGK